jgi:DNA-binding XRE family transcriptional regulator
MELNSEVLSETEKNFAVWVRSRRIAVMLTQEELAERCGLSVRTVRGLETGHNPRPRLTTKRLVIAALQMPNAFEPSVE